MSEIEKMYMRCKIKKQQNCSHTDTCYNGSLDECEGCNSYQYPPFTAEKQLELIKWLSINYLIEFKKIDSTQEYYIGVVTDNNKREWWASVNFENALAAIINNLWQDLTEQERKQIAEILRG